MNSILKGATNSGILRQIWKLAVSLILIFLLSNLSNAQSLKLQSEALNSSFINSPAAVINNSLYNADTLKQEDSTSSGGLSDLSSLNLTVKPKLLPDKMSFMEKFLWKDNGLMRKVGITGPLNSESRRNELQARRTMLSIHQITGLATLGFMITADYFGQRVLNGRLDLSGTHKTFVGLTIGSYAVTGLLAILSPPPMIRRANEQSTTSIHKTLAWIHLAGMILTPILGSLIVNHHMLNINKAHFHQVSAYLTTAVFAASVVVLTF
ncbi:MAG: hypothetical protein WB996_07490 [Ignavibacteriaceae bacterium]